MPTLVTQRMVRVQEVRMASFAASAAAPELIDFVDFKWLMATEGHRVDLERLRDDPAYARGCLALAAGSRQDFLRQAAERLRPSVLATR
jgi:hypothetical protein